MENCDRRNHYINRPVGICELVLYQAPVLYPVHKTFTRSGPPFWLISLQTVKMLISHIRCGEHIKGRSSVKWKGGLGFGWVVIFCFAYDMCFCSPCVHVFFSKMVYIFSACSRWIDCSFFFTLKVHDMHNMETLLIQWVSMAPWISLLMGFECNQKL